MLVLDVNIHHKNRHALTQYHRHFHVDIVDFANFESAIAQRKHSVLFSPAVPIHVHRLPDNIKLCIFGPHFSVFPEEDILAPLFAASAMAATTAAIYVQPSDWARMAWVRHPLFLAPRAITLETLPFGVDTHKFQPAQQLPPSPPDQRVFVYLKRRLHAEFAFALQFLQSINIHDAVIFDVTLGYNEEDYLACLRAAKFGLWIGSHESQGFALLECLSCNVPLLLWDATSMAQEIGGNHPHVPATSAPYWDARCGEKFTDKHQLADAYHTLAQNIDNHAYSPRQFVLDNVGVDVCEERLKRLVHTYTCTDASDHSRC